MYRHAFAAVLAAAAVEEAAAAAGWKWESRTMEQRMDAGECTADDPVSLSFGAESKILEFPSTVVEQAESDIVTSVLMDIKYHNNFKVVTSSLSEEQYVLTQCGTTEPTAAQVDAVAPLETGYTRKFFTIPLQRVSMDNTVSNGFFQALGLEDRLVAMSEYSVAPCFQKAVTECDSKLETSWGNATLMGMQYSSSDAVFMDCQPGSCGATVNQSNGVSFNPTADQGNLHQAEYIKVMAAFFNKEEQANALFQTIVTNYQSFTPLSPRPVVAWISFEPQSSWNPDAQFVLSWADYKRQMVADAGYANPDVAAIRAALPAMVEDASNPVGVKYVLKVSDFADQAEAAAAFFGAMSDVYAVVDEVYAWDPSAYDITTFYSTYGVDSVGDIKVLRIDGVMGSSNQLDWYESRVARPDWALEGLRRSLSGDASFRKKYFRDITAAEQPEVVSAAMCSTGMPNCDASTKPEVINHPFRAEIDGASVTSVFSALLISAAALATGF